MMKVFRWMVVLLLVGLSYKAESAPGRFHPEAEEAAHSIWGYVYDLEGEGLDGVLVTAEGDTVTASDTTYSVLFWSGYYCISDLPEGTYTVTPTLEGHRFRPSSQSVTIPLEITDSIDFWEVTIPTITITTDKEDYGPDDLITVMVTTARGEKTNLVDEYIALEVDGTYYYSPDWGEEATPYRSSWEVEDKVETFLGNVPLTGVALGTYSFHAWLTEAGIDEVLGECSTATFSIIGKDITPPGEVTDFKALGEDGQITLAWTNPTDSDFAGVKIMRSEVDYPAADGGTEVYDGTGVNHLDTGLTNGIAYYYTAFTYDHVSNYSSGARASATPGIDTIPPSAVTGLRAVPGDGQVGLDWNDNTEKDLAGYNVYRDEALIGWVTVSEYLDTGLTNGVTYTYGVTALDTYGNESQLAVVTAAPQEVDTVPPDEVTDFTAEGGNMEVALSWGNPGDVDFAGVKIMRSDRDYPMSPDTGLEIYNGRGTDCTDKDVVSGSTYYYTAFTYDEVPNYSSGTNALATPYRASVTINGGEEETNSRSVVLKLICEIDGPVEMIISEDPSFSDAEWKDYTAEKAFTLSSGDGVKTIYARFRVEDYLETAVVNDSIELDTVNQYVEGGVWNMGSSPKVHDDLSVSALLGDDLDTFTLYYWDPQAVDDPDYRKYIEPETIDIGQGYWLKVPRDSWFDDEGRLLSETDDFERLLYEGSNQIGAPFTFDVDWRACQIRKGGEVADMDTAVENGWVESILWAYEEGEYLAGDRLEPSDAYWIKALVNCVLIVPPRPTERVERSSSRNLLVKTDGDNWQIQIKVRCGESKDSYNFLGVSPGAAADRDKHDVAEPPAPPLSKLRLYFPHSDWSAANLGGPGRYAFDFRPPFKGRTSWEIEVVVEGEAGDKVVLEWGNLSQLPAGVTLSLKEGNKVIDMRRTSSYTYSLQSFREVRNLRIIVVQ